MFTINSMKKHVIDLKLIEIIFANEYFECFKFGQLIYILFCYYINYFLKLKAH